MEDIDKCINFLWFTAIIFWGLLSWEAQKRCQEECQKDKEENGSWCVTSDMILILVTVLMVVFNKCLTWMVQSQRDNQKAKQEPNNTSTNKQ